MKALAYIILILAKTICIVRVAECMPSTRKLAGMPHYICAGRRKAGAMQRRRHYETDL